MLRVMLDAFAFFDLWSAHGKGRSGDSSMSIANSVRSYPRTLVLTPSRQAVRQAGWQASRLTDRLAGRQTGRQADRQGAQA